VSFVLSEFARTGANLGEVLNTHPLLVKLGRGAAPSMRRSNFEAVAMLEYDESYMAAARAAGGDWFKAGDWRCARACMRRAGPPAPATTECRLRPQHVRAGSQASLAPPGAADAAAGACLRAHDAAHVAAAPTGGVPRRPFAWRGGVYLAHWIIFAPGEERMAISALDEGAGRVRLAHVLSPLPAAAEAAQRADGRAAAAAAESLSAVAGSSFTREKNWGLAEDGGALLVFHALLPCTVTLAFELGGGDGNASAADAGGAARVASRACYTDAAEATLAATGARRGGHAGQWGRARAAARLAARAPPRVACAAWGVAATTALPLTGTRRRRRRMQTRSA